MSYFPDYRHETDKLNEVDKAYVDGFRYAVELLDTALNNIDDENLLSVEKEVIAKLYRTLNTYLASEEIMMICHLFDKEEYEDTELNDQSPMFNTKRKDNEE